MKELAKRGHELVVITTDPLKENINNMKQIDVSYSYEFWNNKHNVTKIINEDNRNPLAMMDKFYHMLTDIIIYQLEHPEVQRLINDKNEHFDLLMVEYMLPTFFSFKHRFNCPMIGMASLDSPYHGHTAVGNPVHAVLYPEFSFPFKSQKLSFLERLQSFLFLQFSMIYGELKVFPEEERTKVKYFGNDYPPLSDIMASVDMLFINVNHIFHTIRPLTPATITIGPFTHIKPPKALPKDLEVFLDEAKEGVIYFSLGSNVKSKDIPEETRTIILKTFAKLPYKILWKFEAEKLPGKPDNVKIVKWLPQQDVLRHKNIKLFISQCGLQSLEESLYNYVPLLGLPFFADQMNNGLKLEISRLGISLDYKELTMENFSYSINEMINNPKYKNRVKELTNLVKDEPMTGLERAVWWTEYVLRNKGAQHLKGPAKDIPTYQYYYLDIISFLIKCFQHNMVPSAFLIMCLLIFWADAARILAVFSVPSYSHYQVYNPIINELVRRGHDVVSLTTYPMMNPAKNLRQIDLSFAQDMWHKDYQLTKIIKENKYNPLAMNYMLTYILNSIINAELESAQVQELIKNETEVFDVLLVEFMMFSTMAFKHRFKVPTVGIASMDSTYDGHLAIGNPINPVLYPEYSLPLKDQNLDFVERLISFIYLVTSEILSRLLLYPMEQATIMKYFGENYPYVVDLRNSIDFLLINTNHVFHSIRPLTPATVSIGPGIHLQPLKELPKDLKDFLDSAKEGAIYFSLGSNVKSEDIPDATKEMILKVFSELPYKILWKYEQKDSLQQMGNLRIANWVPQQDVLRHKNIKLFISQCGLQSLEEALFSHVPVVGIPYFGDQDANAVKLKQRGLGVVLDHEKLSYDKFKDAIIEVISNPSYKKRAVELASLIKDEPMTGLERAVFWIEYVIRNRGAQHLKGPGIEMPLYKYYFLDILALFVSLFVFLSFIFYLSYKLLSSIYRNAKFIRKYKNN
ncbi:PREDICTED: UDP-glucuronosyltransferase 2B2-like [Nicrophorus vespilloides]|uniref:UDP-glucuronosyltransferase 2B2-like n=1 Tax=Nicrophorus vespilloides TaxID=110193 RepID=A0ABM1NDB9_NICVS|nr:PREDICTED: UDP-glucuronosyltransferase 2B2-like [Nicrophorus vespilloides]